MNLNTKTSIEMTARERAERETRRIAIQAQIVQDQAADAKRDAKALAAEARWYRKNGQVK